MNHKKKRSLLITGGSGFIAKELSAFLSSKYNILVQSQTPLAANHSVQYLCCPIAELLRYKKKIQTVDWVIHCAGKFSGQAREIFSSNFDSTLAILKIMQALKVPNILFFSTAAIYGELPIAAKENFTLDPQGVYPTSKLMGELILRKAYQEKKIRSAVFLRCNSIYGQSNRKGAFHYVVKNISSSQPVPLDGGGTQVRQPLHVKDLCSLVQKCLQLNRGVHVFNAAGNQSLSIRNLAKLIGSCLNKKVHIRYTKNPAGRPLILKTSIQKAKTQLGWLPKITIAQAVKEMQ